VANGEFAIGKVVSKQLSDSPWAQNEGWRLRPQTPAFYILAVGIFRTRRIALPAKPKRPNNVRDPWPPFAFEQAVVPT
jgi:hypothetical protein